MEADDRRSEDPLSQLAESPYRFDFFAAIRMIDCCAGDAPRTGWSKRPADETLRLRQIPSMQFAATSLQSATRSPDQQRLEIGCNFLGFFGPQGPLPLELTEYAINRSRDFRDDTFARFLDCFQHRILTYFYRAFAATEPTIQHDRPTEDRFSAYLGSLAGVGSPEFEDRDAMPDHSKWHYVGHLGQQNRHADGLQMILSDFFQLPVSLKPFIGAWLTIPEDSRLALGTSAETGTLGVSATMGERIWECQQRVRLVFGPVSLEEYLRFLPGNDYFPKLTAIMKNYVGLILDWEAQIVVRRQDVPQMQLGMNCQLGWVSWLVREPPDRDADDAVLEPRRW